MSVSFYRPSINAGDQNLERVTAQAVDAIKIAKNPPIVFRYANQICRVERTADNVPLVRGMTVDRFIHDLARCAQWYKNNPNGDRVPARPPVDVARDILAIPDPPFPILSRVVSVPVFVSTGELLVKGGYHEESQTLYLPPPGFTLPDLVREAPYEGDVELARYFLLDDLLGGFPFVSLSERAHALCALLLPFARDLIRGPTPFHLIEKPTPGTGGTLLAQVLTIPALGTSASAVTEPKDESEWRRTILSLLRDLPPVIFFDNLRAEIESGALASAITADTYADRVIRTSETLRVPVSGLWIASGNNPTLSAEMARRTVRIRLDAKVERPDLRTGFTHPKLKEWVQEERPWLVWSALILIQAWIAAGRPPGNKTLGMFESWAEVMGGILDVAGVPGFLGNLGDAQQSSDPKELAFRGFIENWWTTCGPAVVSVAELFPLADQLDLGKGTSHSRRIRLGKLLHKSRDMRIHGWQVSSVGERNGVQTWQLQSLPSDGEVA